MRIWASSWRSTRSMSSEPADTGWTCAQQLSNHCRPRLRITGWKSHLEPKARHESCVSPMTSLPFEYSRCARTPAGTEVVHDRVHQSSTYPVQRRPTARQLHRQQESNHEYPHRLRTDLRLPAADPDDIDLERALLARLRHHHSRPPGRRPAGSADRLSRQLWQLVQPHRGAGGPTPPLHRCAGERLPAAGRDPSAGATDTGGGIAGRYLAVPAGDPLLRN